ncbi:MAG: hypothetical protein NC925_01070, partial [Candidatus Omnitrophica bacterium]|nr:hypothetical protein [Candidatus Omnitrophota bacterium]
FEILYIEERERSMIINKRRITSALAKFFDVENLVNFMLDREIKSISFTRGVRKEEISSFLEIFTSVPIEFHKLNLYEIFLQRKITHIQINKISSEIATTDERFQGMPRKLESVAILDFILGKISGKDLSNTNFVSLLKDSPKNLVEQLSKAAELAKRLNKHIDKFEFLLEGMEKILDFIKESKDENIQSLWETKEINKRILDIFFNFDIETQMELIKRFQPKDKFIIDTLKVLNDDDIVKISENLLSLPTKSIWSIKKIFLKLNAFYKECGIDFKEILSSKVSSQLFSEEIKKFVMGELEWTAFPFDKKISEIFKMEKEDLKEFPIEYLVLIITELLSKKDFQKFEDIFIYLRRKGLEYPQELSEKIKNVYVNVFKSIATDKDAVFNSLSSLISSAKIGLTKEDFVFTLDILNSVTRNLDLYQFKRKSEIQNIKILYNLHKLLQENKFYLSEDEINFWEEKFNFQYFVIEMLSSYIEGFFVPEQNLEEFVYSFFSIFLEKIIKYIKGRVSKIYDPFERFLFFRRIGNFIGWLNLDELKKFIKIGFFHLEFNDLYEILSYAKKDTLLKAIENFDSDTEIGKKIVYLKEKFNFK